MSHHWESSLRPLFVKTVYLNGNRHAVLSERDPAFQSENILSKKQSRSDSSLSFSSAYSASTQRSRDSSSDLSIGMSKTRHSNSKDISFELQRCFVKLHITSKDGQRNESNLKGAEKKEDERIRESEIAQNEYLAQRRRKKCVDGDVNCKNDSELSDESYQETHSEQRKKKKKKFWCKKYKSICEGNDRNENRDNFEKAENYENFEKTTNLLNKTYLNNLIMETNHRGKPSNNYISSLPKSSTCDLYRKNYSLGALNTSLTERVVQWMDLVKRQKKHFQDIPRNLAKKSFERNHEESHWRSGDSCDVLPDSRADVHRRNAANDGLQHESFSINSAKDNDSVCDVRFSSGSDAISFVGKTKMKNTAIEKRKTVLKKIHLEKIKPNGLRLKDEYLERNSPMNLIIPKNDLDLTELTTLQNSIINQFRFTVFNKPESVETKREAASSRANGKPKLSNTENPTKAFHEHFPDRSEDFDEGRKRSENDLKIRTVNVFKKRTISAKNSTCEGPGNQTSCVSRAKTGKQKNTTESTKVYVNRNWANVLDNDDANGANLTIKLLSENFLLPNQQEEGNVTDLSKNENVWPFERVRQRQQLHIFIPSVFPQDASD